MVEVGAKPETARVAVASARISMEPATARLIASGRVGKGDVLGVARLAAAGDGRDRRSGDVDLADHVVGPVAHPQAVIADREVGDVAKARALADAVD